MSHELATIKGETAMFAVGQTGERDTVWHRLGQRVIDAVSKDEAMRQAHLDFDVIKVQNQALNPASNLLVEVDSFSTFRKNDGHLLASNLGAGYTIKQPIECFEFADDLIGASYGAHYESAGALYDGRVIWLCARVPNADIQIIGTADKQEAYLVFTTAYDGSQAHTAFITYVRPVCANTIRQGLSSASGIFRIKHTKNADVRFQSARVAMAGVIKDSQHMSEVLNMLAKRTMSQELVIATLAKVFPKPENQKVSTRRDNIMAEVLGLFESNDNNAIPEIRGTAYNFLNALTEFVDHKRTVRITEDRAGMTEDQARAENAILGSGESLKDSALEILLSLDSLELAASASV